MIGVLIVGVLACKGQDYEDEGYGNQGGGNNQGDADNYGGGYGNDDGYSGNMPNNYQQNADAEGSNNNPNNYNPQGGSDADGDYEGDDGTAAASSIVPSVTRVRRSTGSEPVVAAKDSIKQVEALKSESSVPKLRVKRHGKHYIGPVYTYVKTDKHANFKWGVSIIYRNFTNLYIRSL